MTNSREIEVYLGNQRELREKKKLYCAHPPTRPLPTYLPSEQKSWIVKADTLESQISSNTNFH